MQVVAIDFETYYDDTYSVADLGPERYTEDERFDPYLVGIVGEGFKWVGPVRNFPWQKLEGAFLVAHNARFDRAVFRGAQRLGIIPKDLPIEGWGCTADLSVFFDAPRDLKGASIALLGEAHSKEMRARMKGVTYAKALEKGWGEKLNAYCLHDTELCYRLWKKYSCDWPSMEKRLSEMTRDQGVEGIRINRAKLNESIQHLKTVVFKAEANIPWDWDDGKTPLRRSQLDLECRKAGIPSPESLAMDSEECAAWEEKYGEKYPWVGAMRDWRRANMMLQKLNRIRDRLRPNDTFSFSLKLFGGHTGRWSGDSGFNMQNMYRGEFLGVNLRELFIPREGKKFFIADFAQIEARIVLWLAKDFATLAEVARGMSVYEAHARTTMGYTDPEPLKSADPAMYRLAKTRVLGGGFGAGAGKFKLIAKTMVGLELSDDEASKAVADYRASNPGVVRNWRELQRSLEWSCGSDLELEIPSGRMLRYYNVRRDSRGCTAELEKGGGRRAKLFGGMLFENVVQATARDVFAEGMIRLADAGYVCLFHAHDEYVIEVDGTISDAEIKKIEAIITAPVDWMRTCPMAVESNLTDCYTK